MQEAVARLGASLNGLREELPAADTQEEQARRSHARQLLVRADSILYEFSGLLARRSGDQLFASACQELLRKLNRDQAPAEGGQRPLGDICRELRGASRQLLRLLPSRPAVSSTRPTLPARQP